MPPDESSAGTSDPEFLQPADGGAPAVAGEELEGFFEGTRGGAPAAAEQWRPLVEYYFRPQHWDYAVRMIGWESAGNPRAANPTSSARGLFQHMERLWPSRISRVKVFYAKAGIEVVDDIFNPETSVAAAAWLLDQSGRDPKWGGWGQWTPSQAHPPEQYNTPRFGDPSIPFPRGGYGGERRAGQTSAEERHRMDETRWMIVQQRLADLGFDVGEIDGKPGPNTDTALRAFEESVAVTPRGVLGLAGPIENRTVDDFTQDELNRLWAGLG